MVIAVGNQMGMDGISYGIFCGVAIIIVLASSNPLQPANAVTFGDAVNLSQSGGDSRDQAIVADREGVFVVWVECNPPSTGEDEPQTCEILFRRSTDNGASFEDVVDLSGNPDTFSFRPSIAVSGDNVYVMWADTISGTNVDIFFKRSTDGGESFDNAINLSDNEGISNFPKMAVSGRNVYLTWADASPENPGILFSKSTDEGASFGPPESLSGDLPFLAPDISASGRNVYVAWTGAGELLFTRSVDSGETFDSPVALATELGSGGNVPDIASAGRSVYVVWTGADSRDISFAKSSDRGSTFEDTINLSNNEGTSVNPLITISGRNVYVVWEDELLGPAEVLFARSADGGDSFEDAINISESEGSSFGVTFSASGRSVFVAWVDDTLGNFNVFLAESIDEGADFGSPENLSNSEENSASPKIAASGRDVYVTWPERVSGDVEILFRQGD